MTCCAEELVSNAVGVLVSFDSNYRAALWSEEKPGWHTSEFLPSQA